MSNLHSISRNLAEAGIQRGHATAIVEAFAAYTEKNAATNLDLFKVKAELEAAIVAARTEAKEDNASVKAEIKALRNSNKLTNALLIGLIVAVVASSLNS
jgi:FMN-dependent NADH-azoreductase